MWTERLIDLIYILDIALAFRTTYIDGGTGDEIRHPKMLARRYLKEGFPLDFLAAISVITNLKSIGIPMSPVVESWISSFALFKIIRVTRIVGIINKLKFTATEKSQLKILYVLFLLFLFHHLIACSLWDLFSLEKYWIPPKDFGYL